MAANVFRLAIGAIGIVGVFFLGVTAQQSAQASDELYVFRAFGPKVEAIPIIMGHTKVRYVFNYSFPNMSPGLYSAIERVATEPVDVNSGRTDIRLPSGRTGFFNWTHCELLLYEPEPTPLEQFVSNLLDRIPGMRSQSDGWKVGGEMPMNDPWAQVRACPGPVLGSRRREMNEENRDEVRVCPRSNQNQTYTHPSPTQILDERA